MRAPSPTPSPPVILCKCYPPGSPAASSCFTSHNRLWNTKSFEGGNGLFCSVLWWHFYFYFFMCVHLSGEQQLRLSVWEVEVFFLLDIYITDGNWRQSPASCVCFLSITLETSSCHSPLSLCLFTPISRHFPCKLCVTEAGVTHTHTTHTSHTTTHTTHTRCPAGTLLPCDNLNVWPPSVKSQPDTEWEARNPALL